MNKFLCKKFAFLGCIGAAVYSSSGDCRFFYGVGTEIRETVRNIASTDLFPLDGFIQGLVPRTSVDSFSCVIFCIVDTLMNRQSTSQFGRIVV